MKTYLNITRIIFLLIISLYALYFVNFPKIISDWVVVDLLINYEGGFVRRGLLGQLNLFFEKELNFSNLLFSIIIISVIYFINITATYLRLPNNKNRFFLFWAPGPRIRRPDVGALKGNVSHTSFVVTDGPASTEALGNLGHHRCKRLRRPKSILFFNDFLTNFQIIYLKIH